MAQEHIEMATEGEKRRLQMAEEVHKGTISHSTQELSLPTLQACQFAMWKMALIIVSERAQESYDVDGKKVVWLEQDFFGLMMHISEKQQGFFA